MAVVSVNECPTWPGKEVSAVKALYTER